ncbi:RnfABCDGE type electron transport complex subunit B [Treponema pedis]|uniref:RnfABCDGE type electron transport complex subunit B n=1 Tax=Treponema pedis TaxID=409322 RepID=UPI000401371B|nr:RnfABCDGE type electron transport complex subunit B [Treponema pedis]
MKIILLTLAVSLSLSLVLGFLLGIFKKIFYVETDKTVAAVRAVLPGANCGACGFPGCDGFAAAVAAWDAPVNGCPVGAAPVAQAVGKIMGVEASASAKVAVLTCQGSHEVCLDKCGYVGIKTCKAAKISINGTKECDWGCIGLGDCEYSCPFDAIHVNKASGLPEVDYEKCTGCGVCVAQCPQHVLSLISADLKGALALCSCRNPKKAQIMKNCKRGCIKCMKCEKNCPKEAIKVINGIPVVDYSLCDSCNKCVEGCPTKVLVLAQNKVTYSSCSACSGCKTA